MNQLRLIFMGTPEFAVPTLRALIDAGHDLATVYSQPPRPAGRGQKARKSPVQAVAEEAGIEVRTPKSLKDAAAQRAFQALGADAAVIVAYGLILPPEFLAAPRLGCVNLHASLLPRWRGAAPIQRAIMAGDEMSGVTAMLVDQGLDTGPILLQERCVVTSEMTAGALHDSLAELGAPLILRALAGLADGTLTAKPQGQDGVSYADKIAKEEGRLDRSQPADVLACQVRGLSPFPGAWFQHGGQRIKVLTAKAVAGAGAPGVTIDDELTVACGDGAVVLERLQRAGKAPMDASAFLRGLAVPAGTRLG
jgi:methionyl-tRNA formyltransferase